MRKENGNAKRNGNRQHRVHNKVDFERKRQRAAMREWREDEIIEQTRYDITRQSDHRAKYRPPGLLALTWSGDIAIAIQLGQHCTDGETQKESEAKPGLIDLPGGKDSHYYPISKQRQGQPACPTRYKLSIRKHKPTGEET